MRVWDMQHSIAGESGDGVGSTTKASYPVCIGVGSGHTEGVGCVIASSRQRSYDEGRAAAYSASGDKILKRWDLHNLLKESRGSDGRVVRNLNKAEGVEGVKTFVEITALGHESASSMVCTHSVRAHDKDINCTAIAPNDAIIATGSQDKLLKLWKADNLAPLATLKGHKRGKFIYIVPFFPWKRTITGVTVIMVFMARWTSVRTKYHWESL